MSTEHWGLREPPAALAQEWLRAGLWNDETLPQVAAEGLKKSADLKFRVRSSIRPYAGTIGEVASMGRRLAAALVRRGIGPGDVVALQLPNWSEAAASLYGLLQLGVVLVPIVHIYGSKELGHILEQSGARVLITADRFGRQDFLANLDQLRNSGALDVLEFIVVVDANGDDPSGLTVPTVRWGQFIGESEELSELGVVDPSLPALVGYTSGTTADPKGVVHTHRTFMAELRQNEAFAASDPIKASPSQTSALAASPLSHVTGLMAVIRPLRKRSNVNLLDRWDAKEALDAMVQDQLTLGGGATFFLTSLLDHPDFRPETHGPLIRFVTLGGAPIPQEAARRAARHGVTLTRAYGSTEHPSMTMSLPSDPEPKRLFTDGRLLPGVELLLVDENGRPVEALVGGDIRSRGPDLFVGYIDPQLTADALDAEGWFHTGDLGVLDSDGYLTITG
ncbi:MAG: AMP-binding protein, partial [Acidimicrobiales bacterium]|nr:AMP-binding protein [Acidimicrobiales bacterium]